MAGGMVAMTQMGGGKEWTEGGLIENEGRKRGVRILCFYKWVNSQMINNERGAALVSIHVKLSPV